MFKLIQYAADQLATAIVRAFKRLIGSFKIELTVTAV
jgi:hypothetical protein